MKILIVDNLTLNSSLFSDLLRAHEISFKIYSELLVEDFEAYDLFILTGTNQRYMETIWNEWRDLRLERELIEKSTRPIIGICYGCELIAQIYDSQLGVSDQRIKGDYEIVFKENIGLDTSRKYMVYGNHKFYIQTLGNSLESIATSSYGCEIIKHKNKPIYGLMFHPEKEALTTDGDEILKFIINNI